jgi:hypothetical protein
MVVVLDPTLSSSWPFSGFKVKVQTLLQQHKGTIIKGGEVMAGAAVVVGGGRSAKFLRKLFRNTVKTTKVKTAAGKVGREKFMGKAVKGAGTIRTASRR